MWNELHSEKCTKTKRSQRKDKVIQSFKDILLRFNATVFAFWVINSELYSALVKFFLSCNLNAVSCYCSLRTKIMYFLHLKLQSVKLVQIM